MTQKERKVLVLDNVKYEAYVTCPTKYHYRMERHLRPDRETQYFAFGKALHIGMHQYYEHNRNLEKAIESLSTVEQRDLDVLVDTDDYRSLDRVKEVLEEYHDRFRKDKIAIHTVGEAKMLEKSFSFPLPSVETENAIWDILYTGRIDGIIEVGNTLWVLDHKTTSSKKSNWYAKYEYPNNQFSGYVTGASIILNRHISGVMINLFHILKSGNNFERAFLPYSDYQLEEWIKKITRTTEEMIRDIESGQYAMHTTGCYGMYGRCMFFNLCSSKYKLRESIIHSEYIEDPWSPLEIEDG